MNLAIIVVTYNPNIDDLRININTYINQSEFLVIVDNSDNFEKQKSIVESFNNYKNIHTISLKCNYGIAYAQNLGIKYAVDNGCEFFIEMDQDSQLPLDYVKNIYNSYVSLTNQGYKIAGIGPIAFNKNDNSLYHSRNTKSDLIEVEKTLSSGLFTTLEALKDVGFKDETLFIDLVDWEWCWRARSMGYRIFVNKDLRIPHLLGEGHKNFLLFSIGIPSPIRHYYQYRNSIIVSKLKYVPLEWKIKRFFIHLFKPIFYLLFFDRKLDRLRFIFYGIRDGFLNAKGKFNK